MRCFSEKGDVRNLDQTRRKLIVKANNEYQVEYKHVIKEAGLAKKASQRVCADALRSQGVAFRTPRHKIGISEADAKVRLAKGKVWLKRPTKYWSTKVHGYSDAKSFPLPLTPAQRIKFRQTLITGHLRKPGEGLDKGFTKAREKHSFLGMPSVTISATVAKDKVIQWHEVSGNWNGAAAKAMYEDLKPALVKTWGKRSRYTIVEDGDRKGNRSGKGIKAKALAHIHAQTLPPRTPSLMPLDYSIWTAIIKKVVQNAPKRTETKAEFLVRLRKVAMNLPKGYVKSVIARMRGNIKALVDAQGWIPKND